VPPAAFTAKSSIIACSDYGESTAKCPARIAGFPTPAKPNLSAGEHTHAGYGGVRVACCSKAGLKALLEGRDYPPLAAARN